MRGLTCDMRSKKKAYGEMTEEQEAAVLVARAKRYRLYATEVQQLDYLTQDERVQLAKQVHREAEDIELQRISLSKH